MDSIYEQAFKLYENGAALNDIITDFKPEIRKAIPVNFAHANFLDTSYFGCNGEYWMEAYGYPRIGDILSVGVVSKIGLLTFLTEPEEACACGQ